MTNVTVDAENLWFILQQYKSSLNDKCPSGRELGSFQQYGFFSFKNMKLSSKWNNRFGR